MMTTIEPYALSSGAQRYRVRYRTPDNRQTDKRSFKTKRDAKIFASSVEVSKHKGEFVDISRSKATIGELGPDWLERKTGIKQSTRYTLESAWRVHVLPRWGSTPVSAIEFTAVQKWVSELDKAGKSPTTVKRVFGVLSSILDDAAKDRRILANPCKGVKTPRKVAGEHTYLTHEELHKLADQAGSHGTMVLTLGYCGLRWGEAIGLRVKDLDFDRHRINVNQNAVEVDGEVIVGTPKTHGRRSVPFPRLLVPGLKEQCRDKLPDALIFPGSQGGFMRRTRTDAGSSGWFAGAVKRAGIPRITPHGLRHTAASLAIAAGANVKAVQRMLGHASAAMTLDTYSGLFEDDLDSVGDALNAAGERYMRSV